MVSCLIDIILFYRNSIFNLHISRLLAEQRQVRSICWHPVCARLWWYAMGATGRLEGWECPLVKPIHQMPLFSMTWYNLIVPGKDRVCSLETKELKRSSGHAKVGDVVDMRIHACQESATSGAGFCIREFGERRSSGLWGIWPIPGERGRFKQAWYSGGSIPGRLFDHSRFARSCRSIFWPCRKRCQDQSSFAASWRGKPIGWWCQSFDNIGSCLWNWGYSGRFSSFLGERKLSCENKSHHAPDWWKYWP